MNDVTSKETMGYCPCRSGRVVRNAAGALSIDCPRCASMFEVAIGTGTNADGDPINTWYLRLKGDAGQGVPVSVPDIPTRRESAIIDWMFRNTHSCPLPDDCGLDFESECAGFGTEGCRACVLRNIVKYGAAGGEHA